MRDSLLVLRALIIAINVALLVGCQTASTDVSRLPIHVLRVGTSGDYAPFSLEAGQGKLEGFEIELARRFAKDHRVQVQFVRFRWPEMVGDLISNRFDVAMSGVTVRPERSLIGRFTVPTTFSGAVAIVPSNSVARSVAELDRPGARLGVNAGGHLERVTRKHFTKATIVTSPNNNSLPDLLAQGGCDAIISDTVESSHWVARVKGARVLGPFTRDTKAWFLRKEDDELATRLDRWLLARESDGTLDRLRRRYFGTATNERSAEPLAALLAAVVERLELMPLVAESKRGTGQPIEDQAQEARVVEAALDGVRKAARARGCAPPDENALQAFFRAQIEAAKTIQHQTLAIPASATQADVPDLDRQLRPALARISERMSRLVVELRTNRHHGEVQKVIVIVGQTSTALQGRGLTSFDGDPIAHALIALTHSDYASQKRLYD